MALQNINFRNSATYEQWKNNANAGLNINTDDSGTVVTPFTIASLAKSLGWYEWHYQRAELDKLFAAEANPLAKNDIITGEMGNGIFVGSSGNDELHGNGGHNLLIGDDIAGTGQNFVLNESFETFDINAPGVVNGSGFYGLPNGALANRTIEGGLGEVVSALHGRGSADQGTYWLDMNASPGNITISQTINGLTAGGAYVLQVAAADSTPDSPGGSNDSVDVFFGGNYVGTIDPANNTMTNFTFLVNNVGPNTLLEFRSKGDGDNQGIALDNIRLQAFDANAVGGNDGNDLLTGTAGNDRMYGGGGNDTMHGNGGSNSMFGGAGNDLITVNGNGMNNLVGGAGNDTVYGGDGSDNISLAGTDPSLPRRTELTSSTAARVRTIS